MNFSISELTIIPAGFLTQNAKAFKYKTLISFGPAELLEQSYMAGASDYLKDPWNCKELIIRCRPYLEDIKFSLGDDIILFSGESFKINNKIISLTNCQNRLLKILLKNSNAFLSYPLLTDYLGLKPGQPDKSLHVHIHNLRKILKTELPEQYGDTLRIVNSSSLGYAMIVTCG